MRWARLYLAGCVAMGALLVADATVLLFGPPGPLDLMASLVELAWLPASLVAVIAFWRAELPLGVPLSFVAYTLASWLHSFYLIAAGVTPESLRLPLWLVILIDLYGTGLAVAAARTLRRLGDRAP